MAQGGAVDDHATGFGDRRGGGQGQAGFTRRREGVRIVVGIQAAQLQAVVVKGNADRAGREANGRVNRACGGIEHDEAVAAASGTGASSGRACSSGFEFGGRVKTRGDGLLQLFNRRCGLRGGSGEVGAAVRRVSTPLGIATQVQGAAVGQLQGDGTGKTGHYLLANEQAITFNENAPDPFRGYSDYLANNAFDDCDNIAHWILRTTRSIGFHAQLR
ncbi:hypothetical protein D3C77_475980 [compost metagenome]